ncbi:MAG: endopeptidase La [Planctomycetota bacterium]
MQAFLDVDERPPGGDEPQTEPGVLTVDATDTDSGPSPLVPVEDSAPSTLFVFPLKRAVPFPGLVMPVLADGKGKDIIEKAHAQSPYILLLRQRDPNEEAYTAKAFHEMGVLARVHKILTMPNGNITAICGGMKRARVEKLLKVTPYPIAKVHYPSETNPGGVEIEAHKRSIPQMIKSIAAKDTNYGEELATAALNLETPGNLADFAAAYFLRDLDERQRVLESLNILERLRLVNEWLTRDNEVLTLGKRIQDEIRDKIEKQQKQFFLREQLKAIKRELGEEKDRETRDRDEYVNRIDEAQMPAEVFKKAMDELERLAIIPQEATEYAVVRNYLDWLCSVPWSKSASEENDPDFAERILNEDHYGLEEVKERIVEFLGVRKLRPDKPSPILCLVGPPGVGKTSLGRSIARATKRPFVRSALGGIRDEAEIRGHRRTYVGALPGRIVQELKNAKVNNPVFLLDEIDKLGSDFRGDPSSALLEVLDPEQNKQFRDHYLDVPVDLSKILFVTTANVLDTIPAALRDRLEIIELPGYVTEEKVSIARRYLLPRQSEAHGLAAADLEIPVATIRAMIEGYTREAGVRTLEKRIEKIARRRALTKARRSGEGKRAPAIVKPEHLIDLIGPAKYLEDRDRSPKREGVAVGLAWTGIGGDVLSIEAARWPGKGNLQLTGHLGEVMTESVKIAAAFLRANAPAFSIKSEDFEKIDLHVHFPAGATPKDGPSAGITIAAAILSLLRGQRVARNLAMTGELTLTGEVLPIGGVREKVLVAKRFGISRIILPALNRHDVEELPAKLVRGMKFEYVKHFADVAAIALPLNIQLSVRLNSQLPSRAVSRK